MMNILSNPWVRNIGLLLIGGGIGYGTAVVVHKDATNLKKKVDTATTAEEAAKAATEAFNLRKAAEKAKEEAKKAKAAA